MATYKAPKTISKRSELRKDAATTAFVRVQDVFSKYKRYLTYSGIGVLVLGVGIVSYLFIQGTRNDQAVEHLGGISFYYEQGEYRTALDGSGESLGFIDIIDQYGSTTAGNAARFYAADAAFRLGEYDQAMVWFEDYKGSGDMLEASALEGQAAIHEMRESYEDAGVLYERAASVHEHALRSPEYLKKAARAYAKGDEYAKAEAALLRIVEDYPDSDAAVDLDFHLGFVRARMK